MKQRIIAGMLMVMCMTLIVTLTACSSGGGLSNGSPTPTAVPASPHKVLVTVTDSSITSSITTFMSGTSYDFVVTNKGHSPHDFLIKERPKGSMTGPPPHDGVLYIVNSTQLKPGATRSFNFEFPISAPQSDVQFTTHLAGPSGGPTVQIPVQVKQG